eukprot:scaffold102761_cov51-Phaeocystis_antarctica.AAC.1
MDSTTKAAGHPSGAQARGAQRTWTDGRNGFNNKSCRAPLGATLRWRRTTRRQVGRSAAPPRPHRSTEPSVRLPHRSTEPKVRH